MFWRNGKSQAQISFSDRSFQYGDGCFTTILTKNGQVQDWQAHIKRLDACLTVLKIAAPDWQQVESILHKAVLSGSYAGLKIHISRGEGGRGYSLQGVSEPIVTISNFQYPPHYLDWQQQGVKLGVCDTRLGIQPLLAGHKHNNRLEQILAKAELDPEQYVDGIVLDVQNHVIETTMANLFWRQDNCLYTPSLISSGVAGTKRRRIITELTKLNMNCQIGDFPLEQLLAADEIFICNALLGIAPVTHILAHQFAIGSLTKQLQGRMNP